MKKLGLNFEKLICLNNDSKVNGYEDLFYSHKIPLKIERLNSQILIFVPLKYLSISKEILHEYEKNNLDLPVNDFEKGKFLPRKNFPNKNKIKYRKKSMVVFFAIIFIITLLILKMVWEFNLF